VFFAFLAGREMSVGGVDAVFRFAGVEAAEEAARSDRRGAIIVSYARTKRGLSMSLCRRLVELFYATVSRKVDD